MHEISLCEGLVQSILSELDKLPTGTRLLKARVVVGALRQIVPESLQFAYETMTQENRAKGSRLELIIKPLSGRCRQCSWEGEFLERIFHCPKCESGNVELTGGKELYLDSLEIENGKE